MNKHKTKKQRDTWHKWLYALADDIGERVDDYIDPITNRLTDGLKTTIKERVGLLWGDDRRRMMMLYDGIMKAAEKAQIADPGMTLCEFVAMIGSRIVDAPVRRRSSEEYSIEEYNAVMEETKRMFFERGLTPPHFDYQGESNE